MSLAGKSDFFTFHYTGKKVGCLITFARVDFAIKIVGKRTEAIKNAGNTATDAVKII